jgi:hypothetical protein
VINRESSNKHPGPPEPRSIDGTPEEKADGRARPGGANHADREIVDRCLAGDERAWELLYRRWHPRLVKAIEFMLGAEAHDGHLIEEISARVWYAVLRNDKRLLASYNPERDSGFDAFLMGLARIEMMRHNREERRRQAHELRRGRNKLQRSDAADWQLAAMIGEFASTLSPIERDFFENHLTAPVELQSPSDAADLSASSIWQRRRRIRLKLEDFLKEP